MKTPLPSAVTEGVQRRIVLIDFDWQDADLLPPLLQRPGVAVRLVAGEKMEDAGFRLAELCGLTRTLDLADLTREIFDLALVSDRSPRRDRVLSLLEALRTPCLSPREFLETNQGRPEKPAPKAEPASQSPAAETPDSSGPRAQDPAPPASRAAAASPKPPAPRPDPAETASKRPPPGGAEAEPQSRHREAAPASRHPAPESPKPTAPRHDSAETASREPAAPRHDSAETASREPAAPRASQTDSEAAAASPPASPSDLPARAEHGPSTGPRSAEPPTPPRGAEAGSGSLSDLEAVLERALEDITASVPADRRQPGPTTGIGRALQSLANFPSREDRAALEEALRQLVANTGAGGAELHAGREKVMKLIAQVGAHDPLLEGMVGRAIQLNAPQLIKGLSSPHEGKLWGAWPFRTIQHRAVLAASAIDPQGGVSPWEKMVDEVKERWDRQDRESVIRSFPLLPGQERAWLGPPDFRARLGLAVERNRYDGLRFALHRLEFPGPGVAIDRMCEGLPQLLRGTDYLCRIPPRQVLLLTAVPADAYTHVRRRLLAAWEQAWRECGQSPPAPPIIDLRAELAGPEDAEGFIASADGWLGPVSAEGEAAAASPRAGDRPDSAPRS